MPDDDDDNGNDDGYDREPIERRKDPED